MSAAVRAGQRPPGNRLIAGGPGPTRTRRYLSDALEDTAAHSAMLALDTVPMPGQICPPV